MPITPEAELETVAAQQLGRLLFVLGGLELNLGLALINLHPVSDTKGQAARIEKLSFSAKLDQLEVTALASHACNAETLARWQKWFAVARTLRDVRNKFAHGRWAFHHYLQQIVHVSKLPGSGNSEEVRYTIGEFTAHVARAEEVAKEFSSLRELHPVDTCHKTVMKNP